MIYKNFNNYKKNNNMEEIKMSYEDLKKLVPENLKDIAQLQTAGSKKYGKLAIGFGLAETVGSEALKFGKGSALLITDPMIVKLGMHDVVLESLEKSGFNVDIFSDIEPEPHLEGVRKAQDVVKKGNYTVIIGMGGGSSMDTAKMSAIMGTNPGDILQYMQGTPVDIEPLPLILLPTTSGTGSEVSPFMITTIDGKKVFITTTYGYSTMSLVDPLLTATMPPKVTAATGLDALTHAVEGVITKATPLSMLLASKSVEYVFKYLERAVADGNDLEARYYMCFASVFGMMAYVQGGGLYAHSMSYILTLDINTPHGIGCGVTLPYTLMYDYDDIKDLLAELALTIDRESKGTVDEMAMSTVKKFKELLSKVKVATNLNELGVEHEKVVPYAAELINKYYRKTNPRSMNAEESLKLVESMWSGKLEKI